MKKITPHLWFDKEAKEAAKFYTTVFDNSKITTITTLHDTPSGDADVVSFVLAGQAFMAISAGPFFKFNPSVSFMVACKTKEEVDGLWKKLSKGGSVLMGLNEYPFSKRYGWLQDKYGLSWQIMFTDEKIDQKITPSIMFVGNIAGKAEEAINFYTSVFPKAKVGTISRYGKNQEPNKEKMINYAEFTIDGQKFAAMDSAIEHKFSFNEAISFMVYCDTQKDIDFYWGKMSADPKSEQCGWIKDKYGLSWQIVPTDLDEMMSKGNKEQIARVTKAFLKMKKFDIKKLQEAYHGKK